MTRDEAHEALRRAEDAWTQGDAIITRLVNVALEQADTRDQTGEPVRIGSDPIDEAGYEGDWHCGQVVQDAADELIGLNSCFKDNLRILNAHNTVDPFPRYRVFPDGRKTVFSVDEVVPWMLGEMPVPYGDTLNSEHLASSIRGHVEWIHDRPDAAARDVRLMKSNSGRWREWFKKQMRMMAKPPAGPVGGTRTQRPKIYLLGWNEILDCLDRKDDQSERSRIRRLNETHEGPIVFPGKGAQPKVEKSKFVEWWNSLEARFQELEQRASDKKHTVSHQHEFGKDGTVVPDIAGSVKKRKRRKT